MRQIMILLFLLMVTMASCVTSVTRAPNASNPVLIGPVLKINGQPELRHSSEPVHPALRGRVAAKAFISEPDAFAWLLSFIQYTKRGDSSHSELPMIQMASNPRQTIHIDEIKANSTTVFLFSVYHASSNTSGVARLLK